jgi:hypothetical protein
MAGIGGAVLVLACGAEARAANNWDGLWYLDDAGSHYADHTYSFEIRPDGMWRYDDGATTYDFRTDSKPYPERRAPGFTVTATLQGAALDIVERAYGRDMERLHRVPSADGKTFSGSDTRIYPDGRESSAPIADIRVRGSGGFAGSWKSPAPLPTANPAAPSTTARPHFVISTGDDGTMIWFLPATGELIRGKPGGRPRPLTGPQQPLARTFVWTWLGQRSLRFVASDKGVPIVIAVETLAPDGRTFTDTLWTAGHDGEKDVRVFRKR